MCLYVNPNSTLSSRIYFGMTGWRLANVQGGQPACEVLKQVQHDLNIINLSFFQ